MKIDFHQWSDKSILARLRNYELPSDLETREITLEIEDVEKRLQHTELAAGTANVASNALSNGQHDVLKRHLAYCRAFIAPVRRLPCEILAEIYHIILASIRDRSPRPTQQLKPTRALVVLSQTCCFWRSVIFSTATLWYDIRIPSLFRDARDAHLVEMHLHYSGDSPLDIQIHNSGAHHIPDMDSARKIAEGLLSHRERWRDILIVGSGTWVVLNSACSVVLRQTKSLLFPLLGSLTLEDARPSTLDTFLTAHLPRLRTLNVHGYPPSSFPYHQLTSLSLVLYHSEIHHLLLGFAEHFINLECLRLEGDLDDLPSETNGGIDLLKLKSLIIESFSESFLVLFLTTFRLPALVSIDVMAPLQGWPHVEFTSLLIRSECLSSLTRLALRWAQITDEQLLEILRQTESLEKLIIVEDHTPTLSSSLFQAMSITSTTTAATVIVPKLQHITFSRSLYEKESPFGIEMVASRARTAEYFLGSPEQSSCLPLKSFTILLKLLYTPPELPMLLGKEEVQALRRAMAVTMRISTGRQLLIAE